MLASHQSLHQKPSLLLQITLGVIGVFAFLQVYSIQAILPILQQDFLASETQLGMLVGATLLAVAIVSPVTGMLSDVVGRKKIIIGSIIFLSIPTALMAFSDDLSMMIVWRFLQGLAVPGVTVVTIAYIGEEYAGKDLAKLMSFYVSGTVFGGFLGRFIIGHLHEMMGWRQAFLVMSVAMLLGAFWVWLQLPTSKGFVANPNIQSSVKMLFRHIKNRYVITACLLGACVLFSLVGCFTYINLHLADKPYYLSSAGLANIFAVYLIGMLITPIASTLIANFGAARVAKLAVVMSILGVLLTLTAPLWLIIVGLTIVSSGVFITQSATITYIAVNVTEGRSLATGLYYMSYYTGGMLGAWACGLAYTYQGWLSTVWALLFVQILAFLMASFGLIKISLPTKNP